MQNIIAMNMREIKLQPAIKGGRGGYLNCGLTEDVLPLDAKIIAGFGSATITKDGELFYYAPMNLEWDEAKELSEFEEIAKTDPAHDWRHHLDLPLRSAVYQRHGDGKWVLIE